MAWETWVQSQVESYQRLKKWYLMLPCLTLSIIRQGSRVKWNNPGNGVAPSTTPWCSSYRNGSLRVTLDYGRQLYLHTPKSLNFDHENLSKGWRRWKQELKLFFTGKRTRFEIRKCPNFHFINIFRSKRKRCFSQLTSKMTKIKRTRNY